MEKTNKEIEPVVTEAELTELNEVDTVDTELDEVEEIEPVVTEKVKKEKFLNPFDTGVSYVEFQKALGKKSVSEYCKGKLSDEQITFLETELSILKTE